MDSKHPTKSRVHGDARVPDTKRRPTMPEYHPTLILKYQPSLPETDQPTRVLRRQPVPKGTPDKPNVRIKLSDVQDPTSKPQPAKLITTTA